MRVSETGPGEAPMAAARTPRVPLIDLARGIALLAMFIYHLAWDLRFFGYVNVDIVGSPFWSWFARGIAGTFLALAGVSLVLAHEPIIRWRAFGWRLLLVGGAAMLVSIATTFAVPNGAIYFGILHSIAMSSVIGLALIGRPTWLVLAIAALCLAAPLVIENPLFDPPYMMWLGLGRIPPATYDYVPLLPWFGLFALGMVGGRLVKAMVGRVPALQWAPASALPRLVVTGGRNSLPIYLLHQPVFMALLYGATLVVPPAAPDETREFVRACEAGCRDDGTPGETCARYCACAVRGLKDEGLWTPVMRGQVDAAGETRVRGVADRCRAEPSN